MYATAGDAADIFTGSAVYRAPAICACSKYDKVLDEFTAARHCAGLSEQVFQLFWFNGAVRQYLSQ